jgi:hypothetical protein
VKGRAITPDEVVHAKRAALPDGVFEAFNDLIARHWDGHEAVIEQRAVVATILTLIPGSTKAAIYENKWLDVEDVYRLAGWDVDYDKPGYNENYEATFTFTKKRRKS